MYIQCKFTQRKRLKSQPDFMKPVTKQIEAITTKKIEIRIVVKIKNKEITMWLLPAFPTSPELKLFNFFSFKFRVILCIKYSILLCQRWSGKILKGKKSPHRTHCYC